MSFRADDHVDRRRAKQTITVHIPPTSAKTVFRAAARQVKLAMVAPVHRAPSAPRAGANVFQPSQCRRLVQAMAGDGRN